MDSTFLLGELRCETVVATESANPITSLPITARCAAENLEERRLDPGPIDRDRYPQMWIIA
jgi:hypothetical protein